MVVKTIVQNQPLDPSDPEPGIFPGGGPGLGTGAEPGLAGPGPKQERAPELHGHEPLRMASSIKLSNYYWPFDNEPGTFRV